MRRWLKHLLTAIVAMVIVALLVWAFLPTAVEVEVGRVTRGDLVVTIDHEGKTRVKERYVVSSPLEGRLLRIELKPGDEVVSAETLLAVIEPADPDLLDARSLALAEARVEAAKAAQEQAKTQVDRAKVAVTHETNELERIRGLQQRQTATQREYETALYRQQTATADLHSAEFALRIADFELEQAEAALIHSRPQSLGHVEPFRFEIPAPINGVVLRVLQESATVVQPGTPLLEIGDLRELECEVDVLSTDAVKIEPGQRVILDYWGGTHPLEGRVRVREPAAFVKISALGVEEQRVNIIIDLVDPPSERPTLGDGYRVEAQIVVWEGRDILKVPAGTLFRRGDDWAVFIIENGRAVLRQVEVGKGDGLEMQILDGLDEGDRVILHPTDRVEAGVRVTSLEVDQSLSGRSP